jgi:hypothetical protein
MADTKLKDLPAATAIAPTDLLYVVATPATDPQSKKITFADMMAGYDPGGGGGASVFDGASVQIVHARTTTYGSTTTQIPIDNSKPQQTEGAEVMTCPITPKRATHKLWIHFQGCFGVNPGQWVMLALFQDAGLDAIASAMHFVGTATAMNTVTLDWVVDGPLVPGVLTTFKIRVGRGDSASTIQWCGSGAPLMGGTMPCSITIQEIDPTPGGSGAPGSGDVTGPGASVLEQMAVYADTTGKVIKGGTVARLVNATATQRATLELINVGQVNLGQNVRIEPVAQASWLKDDLTKAGSVLTLNNLGGFSHYHFPAGSVTPALQFGYDPATNNLLLGGGIRERNRTVPMGEWTDVPYNAADFYASGSMTWTVEAGDLRGYRYMIVGKTLFIQFAIVGSSVGGTASTALMIKLPAGLVVSNPSSVLSTAIFANDGPGGGANNFVGYVALNQPVFDSLLLAKQTQGVWALTTNQTNVWGSCALPLV